MSSFRDMIQQNQEYVRSKKDLKLLEKTIELEQGHKNPSIKLIQEIWGMAVGIAAITIPLLAMGGTKALIIPILAIAGAAVSTAFLSKKITPTTNTTPSSEVVNELREMRQSVNDLRSYVMHLEQSIDDKQLRQAIDKASVQTPSQASSIASTNGVSAPAPSTNSAVDPLNM
jgi:hypothetical protein